MRELRIVLFAAALASAAWNPFRRRAPLVEAGAAALKKGEAQEAAEKFKAALAKLGERPPLLFDYGTALAAAGKYDEAISALKEASVKGDRQLRVRARYNLGNAYARKAQATTRQAAGLLSQAVQALSKAGPLPDKPSREQCEAFKKIVAQYEKAAAPYRQAAELYGKAFQEYRQVLLRAPGHYRAKWNLEVVAGWKGRAEGVVREAERLKKVFAERCGQGKKQQDKQQQKQQNEQQNKKREQKQQQQQQQQRQQKEQQKRQEQQQARSRPRPRPGPQEQRRRQAERALDRLEKQQRRLRRQRLRGLPHRIRVTKDW